MSYLQHLLEEVKLHRKLLMANFLWTEYDLSKRYGEELSIKCHGGYFLSENVMFSTDPYYVQRLKMFAFYIYYAIKTLSSTFSTWGCSWKKVYIQMYHKNR